MSARATSACVLLALIAGFHFPAVPSAGARPQESEEGGICFVRESKARSGREALPSACMKEAEILEKRFNRITGFPQGNLPPVFVTLPEIGEGHPRWPSFPGVDVLEGGRTRISITLTGADPVPSAAPPATGLSRADRRNLVRALLLRQRYGSTPPQPGSAVILFPEWLARGLSLLCSAAGDSSGSLPEFDGLWFPREMPLETFLSRKPPEGSEGTLSALYDRMAACLVLAGMKENGTAFRTWITSGNGNPAPWPAGWGMDSVARRWHLIMASASAVRDPAGRIRSASESLEAYDRIAGNLPGSRSPTFSAFRDPKAGGIPGKEKLLASLASFRLEANPLVLPLVDRSSALVSRFPRIAARPLEKEIVVLGDLREGIRDRSEKIAGYLDWYEAARLEHWSGEFDALLAPSGEPRRRKGPVGDYLDAVEARGW